MWELFKTSRNKLTNKIQQIENRFSQSLNFSQFFYFFFSTFLSVTAMLYKLDRSVGEVIGALSKRSMLANSIIVFSTDNGGPAAGFNLNAASNWPLRGVKNTLWEGELLIFCYFLVIFYHLTFLRTHEEF